MSTDYAEKEREFIDGLEAGTGRTLGAWMAAIDAEALPHRNDIIDWLRGQGFSFARASWLERIHHNGGRRIYLDAPLQAVAETPKRPEKSAKSDTAVPPASAAGGRGASERLSRAPDANRPTATAHQPSGDAALEPLLAKAKAYRPLARFVLSEIAKAVPAAIFTARETHVSIGAPAEFAVLAISARDVTLGLAGGSRLFDDRIRKAKFSAQYPGVSPGITHMAVLTDAREVDSMLIGLIASAAGNVRE